MQKCFIKSTLLSEETINETIENAREYERARPRAKWNELKALYIKKREKTKQNKLLVIYAQIAL